MVDETEKQKDALPEEGQSSDAGKGTEPKPPRTYTEAEMQKTVSNHRAELGRIAKKAKEAEEATKFADNEVKEVKERMIEWERQRESAEFDAIKGDPDLLRVYQDKQAIKRERERVEKDKRELERDRLQHKETIEAMQRFHRERLVEQVASIKGVSAKLLLRSNASSQEELEDFAEELKASTPKTETITPTTTPTKPDSGMTSGVSRGKTPSLEELRASKPEETARKVKSGEWVLPGWR